MESALDFALLDINSGLRESGGKNRGELIDEMNRLVWLPPGSPYCASGVSHCFRRYAERHDSHSPFPYCGGSQLLRATFEERGLLSRNPQDLLKWHGALFCWTNPGGERGHVGFVQQRLTANGKVVAIQTAEYNTSPAGSRDGDGAYSLRRGVPIDGVRRLVFLSTSEIDGGSWWD